MQLKALVLAAIAAVAAAAPSDAEAQHWGCDPATYACTWKDGKPGWKVCDTNEKWQVRSAFSLTLYPLAPFREVKGALGW